MSDVFVVDWDKRITKQLVAMPDHIVRKFYRWVNLIKFAGLRETRKSLGYHDEPWRQGQRSVLTARLRSSFHPLGSLLSPRGGALQFF